MKLFAGTVVTGMVAILLFLYEWDFGRRARAGQAVVIASAFHGRSGMTLADVLHVADGRQIRATLRAWYCPLSSGQQVRVLYLASDPENVVPDWFWQRHFASTIALVVCMVLTATATLDFLAWRRRQAVALLRDDYVAPHAGWRGTPALPIDTAPRLWDRDLDG